MPVKNKRVQKIPAIKKTFLNIQKGFFYAFNFRTYALKAAES
jgi:hypothetical protein